jgi:hypothetical protein
MPCFENVNADNNKQENLASLFTTSELMRFLHIGNVKSVICTVKIISINTIWQKYSESSVLNFTSRTSMLKCDAGLQAKRNQCQQQCSWNMVSENLTVIAVCWSKMCQPWLTANWNTSCSLSLRCLPSCGIVWVRTNESPCLLYWPYKLKWQLAKLLH